MTRPIILALTIGVLGVPAAALLAQSGAYSYEEIGAMLKVPTGTIKWRVSEARKIIRQQLRERGYGDVV